MGENGNILFTLIFYVVIIGGFFYFFIIRPQKKKEKIANDMRNALKTGDDIVTIGGICGKVANIKDDEITIESGIDKTKIKFKKEAISRVEKPISDLD